MPERGAQVASADHILYYVKPTQIDDGVVSGGAFVARPSDHDGLSVNWLEWFDPPIERQIDGVRSVARITYRKSGRLARLNVGNVKRHVRENAPFAPALLITHDPLAPEGAYPADPTHALVDGAQAQRSDEAALVGDLIAECIIPPLFLAVRGSE